MKKKDDILLEVILVFADRTVSQNILVKRGINIKDFKNLCEFNKIVGKALTITNSIAINGQKVEDDYVINEPTRLVVLRSLRMDPKEMRRKRHAMRVRKQ